MGSKKKKRSDNRSGGNDRNVARNSVPDMSKYAGASSNKSKRNYSDINLKLVKPDNLIDYVSGEGTAARQKKTVSSSAEKKSNSRRPDAASRKSTGANKSQAKSSPKSSVKGSEKIRSAKEQPVGQQGKKTRSKASSFDTAGQSASSHNKSKVNGTSSTEKKQPVTKGVKKSAPKKTNKPKNQDVHSKAKQNKNVQPPVKVEYPEDEYTKALSGSDIYSSVIEKYYMKHPEEKRESLPRRKPAPKPSKPKRKNAVKSDGAPITGGGSVAEMAVMGRGSKEKAKLARVVKNGRARGVVTPQAAHRRVRQRNRRRSLFSNALIMMAVILLMLAVYVTVFFNVKVIKVNGTSRYQEQQIISSCKFNKGDNILFVNTTDSVEQIYEKLPYIEECTITRKLPSTVVVNIEEAKCLGLVKISDSMWIELSRQGKVLEAITNASTVSASDIILSVTYSDDMDEIEKNAIKQGKTIIEGLDLQYAVGRGALEDSDMKIIKDLVVISDQAEKTGIKLSRMTHEDIGYSVEYDGRIKIMLGDISDKKTLEGCMNKAYYIIFTSGDLTDHDRGTITYIKNQTFFSPEYETADEE